MCFIGGKGRIQIFDGKSSAIISALAYVIVFELNSTTVVKSQTEKSEEDLESPNSSELGNRNMVC